MTTLSEWLLAQIAEDEALARASIAEETQTRTYFDGSTKTFVDTGVWQTSGKPGDYDENEVLAALALPYADRPGYDEEWGP